jgi:hypothetical protein
MKQFATIKPFKKKKKKKKKKNILDPCKKTAQKYKQYTVQDFVGNGSS